MSRALAVAFAGSVFIHAAALLFLGADQAQPPARPPLLAKLVLPPKVEAAPPAPAASELVAPPVPALSPAAQTPSTRLPPVAKASMPAPSPLPVPVEPPVPAPQVEKPAKPQTGKAVLPIAARGAIRYLVIRGTQGMIVGRAEHEWEFGEGNYILRAVTETIGLAALVKPVRMEIESRGRLTPEGLRPQRFLTRRNGVPTDDTAEFDWEKREVALSRGSTRQGVEAGAQDLLSFHYQLAYLPKLEEGTTLQVATARRVENYRFQIIGEEQLETEIGVFRTLHLKTQTGTTTELWLALDHGLLPIKIRHIDRKGDIYDQIVNEMGTPEEKKNRPPAIDNRMPAGFTP
ncbi:MAG: hypothetical protein H6R18_1211 [Proteobacteria bacterium]|nr:hypothetical protein [Pseudomonadota bacterium]